MDSWSHNDPVGDRRNPLKLNTKGRRRPRVDGIFRGPGEFHVETAITHCTAGPDNDPAAHLTLKLWERLFDVAVYSYGEEDNPYSVALCITVRDAGNGEIPLLAQALHHLADQLESRAQTASFTGEQALAQLNRCLRKWRPQA